MVDENPTFTASEIARALGVSRKTISEQLAGVRTALKRTKAVRGQAAKAVEIADLPNGLRNRIESAAARQGFEDAGRFVEIGRKPWNPSIPIGKLPARAIDTAKRRAIALASFLKDRGVRSIEEIARECVQRVEDVGRISAKARTVRHWIDRAIERDRGFENWERWEIYLDDGLRPVGETAAEIVDESIAQRVIHAIEDLKDAARPTREEISYIWMRMMDDADALVRRGTSEKRARVLLAGVVWRTGVAIAKTREALLKQFQRKREGWLNTDGSIAAVNDGRVVANRDRRWELPEDDYRAILKHAIAFEHLATGYNYARNKGLLSKETMERFQAPNADKSYVPHSIRKQVMPELKRLLPYKIGPYAARMAGPYADRDYSGMNPGDWWQSDDMTGVYQFYDVRTDGSLFLGQGQFLPMIDLRSLFILGFVLIPHRAYTAASIRELITRCHDAHGLPRHGFYFERGIWERARLLKGRASDSEVPLAEMEKGLREFGLHFEHARNPRAKVIEGVFSHLQVKMQTLPGYSGRDARKDMPEAIKKQIADVTSNRVHPSRHFLSKAELAERMEQICGEWNAEKHGKRARILAGKSPDEMYSARTTDDVQHLPEGFRHLLASHRFPMDVGRNGIKVAKSFGNGRYVSPELLNRKGETVLVWLDLEDLTRVTVTDLNHESPLVVPRFDPIPAMGASPDEIGRVMQLQRAVVARGTAVFKVLGGGAVPFRKVVVNVEDDRRAAEFRKKNEEFVAQRERVARQEKQIEKLRREIAENGTSVDELDALEDSLVARGVIFPSEGSIDRRRRGLELVKNALEEDRGSADRKGER